MKNEIKFPLSLDLQYFATDSDAEQTHETNPNAQPPTETQVDSSDSDKSEKVKTFTQAELDDILAKRLERATKKFADYDDLKAKADAYAAELEAKRQSELTETERAQELAKQFEAEKAELSALLEAERTKAQQERIRNEFTKVASSANIIDIDAAIALSDLSTVEIDDDGKVSGVDDVIKTLVENKPYLVAKKHTQPIGTATNGGTSGQSEKSAEQLLADAAEKARKSGTLADKVKYAQLKKQLKA